MDLIKATSWPEDQNTSTSKFYLSLIKLRVGSGFLQAIPCTKEVRNQVILKNHHAVNEVTQTQSQREQKKEREKKNKVCMYTTTKHWIRE